MSAQELAEFVNDVRAAAVLLCSAAAAMCFYVCVRVALCVANVIIDTQRSIRL